ncbi:MAG: DUF4404 family protein [Myxococcales bacterium]|nr:DUF4404 family protein [Myxococcales bacterium]
MLGKLWDTQPAEAAMPERRKRLTAKLNEVDEHLESAGPVDSAIEEPLQAALGNVREAVEAASADDEEHEELTEALGDLALRLEVSHPKLTELLNHISELFAGAGI